MADTVKKTENQNGSRVIFSSDAERLDYLRAKAAALPRTPGIYMMRDKTGKVIYVGKSRSLRDRVSQYFHSVFEPGSKTARMVSLVADFDNIFCDTEIEALALENSTIKQYQPKYNIKLKDAKTYPYIKVDVENEYPRITMTRRRGSDKSRYFGPYSGTGVVFEIIKTLERSLGIPSCKRVFPRDIGAERPCMYKQLGRCIAPCTGELSPEEYRVVIDCAVAILRGNTREAVRMQEERMYACAEEERFEEAARCRDSIEALNKLGERQKVIGAPDDEYDIVARYDGRLCSVVSVFYIRSGVIMDNEHFTFDAGEIAAEDGADEAILSLLADLYRKREYIPPEILLSFEMGRENRETLEGYLKQLSERKITVRTPMRGDLRKLCRMAEENAERCAAEYIRKSENDNKILMKMASMLSLEVVPDRIEVYDISNYGSEHITAGMIVSENGTLKKKDYRTFKMRMTPGDLEKNIACGDSAAAGADRVTQNDYAAMQEALFRRLSYLTDQSGEKADESFSARPDLIFVDGGKAHASVISRLVRDMGLDIPVFGMVKDEHHKTRMLVGYPGGIMPANGAPEDIGEISIAREQSVFVFVYKLQEEIHRFTVSKVSAAKRKTMKKSSLEAVKGIGPAKAKAILDHFVTVTKLREASVSEIEEVRGISRGDAEAVYSHLHRRDDK